MNDGNAIRGRLQELLAVRDWSGARDALQGIPAPDVADILPALDKQNRGLLFRLLPKPLASDAFSNLEPARKDELLRSLSDDEACYLLADLYPDDLAEFLEEMPGQATQRLLNLLGPDDRREALQLLGYPERSMGRLMKPYYVAVRPGWTVAQALDYIRERGQDSETIHVIQVVDVWWKLLDTLSLRRFILASPDDTVERLMDRSFVSITAYEDRRDAVRMIQHYDLVTLPVVDSDGVLPGIVTVDDVLDVAEKEVTEDFQRVAAATPLKTGYRDAGIRSLFTRRTGWLGVLIVVNLASGCVIAFHEDLLMSSIALVFFIPLLIATGGKAGAQSATLMERAVASSPLVTSKADVVGLVIYFSIASYILSPAAQVRGENRKWFSGRSASGIIRASNVSKGWTTRSIATPRC